jgi:hypothetical protein
MAGVQADVGWGEVLIEEATEAAGRARLARHAVALERARHPGVAELVEHRDDGERAELVVRTNGRRTLADLPRLVPDQVAAVGASLAQTLADLHRAGVSHGALRGTCVFLTPAGQPVLTGFADAGLADPPPGHTSGFDPAGDVEALADLLEQLIDPNEGGQRRAAKLVTLLHNAAGSPAEQLAAGLAELAAPVQAPLREDDDTFGHLGWISDATREFWPLPPTRGDKVAARRAAGRRPLLLVVLGIVALVAGLVVVLALGGSPSGDSEGASPTTAAPESEPADAASASASAAPETAPAVSAPPSGAAPDVSAPATEVTAPCPATYDEAASVGIPSTCLTATSDGGNAVRVGPLRWTIGSEHDVAVLGDFDCDGWLEAAALALDTGQVVTFDTWAGAGQEPTGRVVRVVPGATRLESSPDGACHRLQATRPGDAPVDIDVKASA